MLQMKSPGIGRRAHVEKKRRNIKAKREIGEMMVIIINPSKSQAPRHDGYHLPYPETRRSMITSRNSKQLPRKAQADYELGFLFHSKLHTSLSGSLLMIDGKPVEHVILFGPSVAFTATVNL